MEHPAPNRGSTDGAWGLKPDSFRVPYAALKRRSSTVVLAVGTVLRGNSKVEIKINSRVEIKINSKVEIKINSKVKGSGRGRPLHTDNGGGSCRP
jgi:hypothetical protein